MATPPEVHSAALHGGPGAAQMLAAAAAWTALSVQYASAAIQLALALGAVQSMQWRGVGAESYVAVHEPYMALLEEESGRCANVAAEQEVAATAYGTALAVMPSVPELTANRVALTVLVATNFFGINLAPIAVVEEDYARMWVQAATAMSIYEGESVAAVASASPSNLSVPHLLRLGVGEIGDVARRGLGSITSSVTPFAPPLLPTLFGVIGALIDFVGQIIVPLVTIVTFPLRATVFLISQLLGRFFPSISPFTLTTEESMAVYGLFFLPLGAVGLGAEIALSVSLPLGIDRHVKDLQIAAEAGTALVDDVRTAALPLDTGLAGHPLPEPFLAAADVSPKVPVSVLAGERSAGGLGFAGTGIKETVGHPAGLTALADSQFRGGPQAPMLPATWVN